MSSIGGTVSHLDESRRATAEVPTTVAAHSATLAEIIRDNQLMHEALLILTQSSKSLTVDLAPVREAALNSAPRALVDALSADVTIVQKTLEHLTAITSTLSKVSYGGRRDGNAASTCCLSFGDVRMLVTCHPNQNP